MSILVFTSNAQKTKTKGRTSPSKTPITPAVMYEKAEIKFDSLTHNFQEVIEGQDAIFVFVFYNIGKEPLTILDARPGCSCTVSDYTKEPVMPGKSGSVQVKYGTRGRMGVFTKVVTVTSNASISPIITLTINGNVIAAPQEVH